MRSDSRRPAGRSHNITALLHCIAPFKQLLHAARPPAFVGSRPACGRARFAPSLTIGALSPAWSMRMRAPRSAVSCRLGCVPRRAIGGPRFAAALRLALLGRSLRSSRENVLQPFEVIAPPVVQWRFCRCACFAFLPQSRALARVIVGGDGR